MVAITVILAAVIAAFVLDMGSGLQDSAQAGVQVEDDGSTAPTVNLESLANADGVTVIDDSGNVVSTSSGSLPLESVGEGATIDGTTGTEYDIVAYYGEETDRSGTTIVGTVEYDT